MVSTTLIQFYLQIFNVLAEEVLIPGKHIMNSILPCCLSPLFSYKLVELAACCSC